MRAYVRVRQLTEEEYQELKRWERSRKMAAGKVKRARVVLLSNQGYTRVEIAQRLEMDERTVRRWMGRFNQLGIPGLAECPRKGRPRVYKAEEVSVVIETALTKPDALALPFAAWTLDRLVSYLREEKGINMSRSRMSEIFKHEGLRWRQQEGWFGHRVDPDFAEKRGSLSGSILIRPSIALSSA